MEKTLTLTRTLFQRDFFSVFIIVVNSFSWFFPMYIFFQNALEKILMDSTLLSIAFGVQFVATIGFAIIGITLMKRFRSRATFLSIWMLIGIITSMMMITLETYDLVYVFLVSFLLGTSLGLGFPSCLAYFGECSTVQNRGLLAGITFFASSLCIVSIGFLLTSTTLLISTVILTTWRGVGLFLFILVKPKNHRKENTIEGYYKSILFDRSFLLYLVPWTMFCLINFIEFPVTNVFFGEEFAPLITISEFSIGGFVAMAGGWFADSVGRKRIVIFGFIMLGIGYGLLGLFSQYVNVFSWYLFIILDGFAWGIFSLIFYLVIWADLAENRRKEKYYMIGISPFLISSYIQILITPYAKDIPVSTAFPLASFFLFLAVLPLLYTPETLPEKQIELKRLRKFADDAKKTKEKYERKRGEKI